MPYETPPQSAPPGPVRARLEAAFGVGTAWTSEAGGSAVAWETPAYHLVWAAAAGTEAALRKVLEARKGRQAYPVVVLALLTREFTRLEEAVVPGLRVKDLLTLHFVRTRLRAPANAQRPSGAVTLRTEARADFESLRSRPVGVSLRAGILRPIPFSFSMGLRS